VYGSCLYLSRRTAKLYYILTGKDGGVEQWELFSGPAGIDARRVRRFDVGGQSEGCVADDELGHLYIAEEAVGIWKYGAEPDAGSTRRRVDAIGPGSPLMSDVEGLAIAQGSGGAGFLIASS